MNVFNLFVCLLLFLIRLAVLSFLFEQICQLAGQLRVSTGRHICVS